ncbi:hypothetical protein MFIFM68171_07992 [Madurella fahalii]|uniref:DUF1993 domain-containing protein n=1 Tax=Madurella fahalii TaxID=1157608 RepID=A0ABQ0GJ43_9PEZI
MSTIPFYDATIGTSTKSLKALLAILKIAKEHPDAASFPDARLYEDMKPFTFQVQTVSNFAKKLVERLAVRPADQPPLESWPDEEQTIDELIARVEKTLDLVATVKPEHLEGAANKRAQLPFGPELQAEMSGLDYVLNYMLPNLYFHLTTAYAILRMKGVPLGKADFLTPFVEKHFPKEKMLATR